MSKKSKALKRRGGWVTKQYFSNKGPHPLATNMDFGYPHYAGSSKRNKD